VCLGVPRGAWWRQCGCDSLPRRSKPFMYLKSSISSIDSIDTRVPHLQPPFDSSSLLTGLRRPCKGQRAMRTGSMRDSRLLKILRVFLARGARVTRKPVSTPMMFRASDCGRLGRQAAGHPWSALRVVKSCRKEAQAIRLASQSDGQKSDRQTSDRQTS
jgi:hypothetical protein